MVARIRWKQISRQRVEMFIFIVDSAEILSLYFLGEEIFSMLNSFFFSQKKSEAQKPIAEFADMNSQPCFLKTNENFLLFLCGTRYKWMTTMIEEKAKKKNI